MRKRLAMFWCWRQRLFAPLAPGWFTGWQTWTVLTLLVWVLFAIPAGGGASESVHVVTALPGVTEKAERMQTASYQALRRLCNRYLVEGNRAQADSLFRQLAGEARSRLPALLCLMRLQLARLDTARARAYLIRALRHPGWSWLALRDGLIGPLRRVGLPHWKIDPNAVSPALRNRPEWQYFQAVLRGDWSAAHRWLGQIPPYRLPDSLRVWEHIQLLDGQGQVEQAVQLAQQALARFSGQRLTRARLYFFLGQKLLEEDVDRTMAYLDSAETLARSRKAYSLLQEILGWKGIVYLQYRFNFSVARHYYQKAMDLATRLGEYRYACVWATHLGETFYQQDYFSRALQVYQTYQRVAAQLENPSLQIRLHWKKGDLFEYLGLFNLAESEYRAARALSEEHGIFTFQTFYEQGLANLAFRQRRFQEAEQLFEQLLQRPHALRQKAFWLFRLGQIAREQGNFARAEHFFLEARLTADSSGYGKYRCWSRHLLGELYLKWGQPERAVQYFRQAWALHTELGEYSLAIQLLTRWGEAFLLQNRMDSALVRLRLAVQLAEEASQVVGSEQIQQEFFAAQSASYKLLAAAYLARARTTGQERFLDSALVFLEMGRARKLRQGYAHSRMAASGNESTGPLDSLDAKLTALNAHLRKGICDGWPEDSLQRTYALLKTTQHEYLLAQLQGATRSKSVDPQLTWQDNLLKRLKSLRQNATLPIVYYCLSNWRSHVIVLQEGKSQILPLSALKDSVATTVQKTAYQLRRALESPAAPEEALQKNLIQLHHWLTEPLMAHLPSHSSLLVIPDESMMELPLEVFLYEESPGRSLAAAPSFLLHRFQVIYAPALVVGSQTPAFPATAKRGLILANPYSCIPQGLRQPSSFQPPFQPGFFLPLIGSEREGLAITTHLEQAALFRRHQATEAALKQQVSRYPILHLACHAFADPWFEDFSGIVLTGSEETGEDGYLYGYEIRQMNFSQTWLVSLSACETGAGRILPGEGVLGLPSEFLAAGAGAVLQTLWKVQDEFTSRFMPRLYRNLMQPGKSLAAAVAEAKESLMAVTPERQDWLPFSHPAQWGSFVLYINPDLIAREPTTLHPILLLLALLGIIMLGTLIWMWRHRK